MEYFTSNSFGCKILRGEDFFSLFAFNIKQDGMGEGVLSLVKLV